jgi:hypothetical protein
MNTEPLEEAMLTKTPLTRTSAAMNRLDTNSLDHSP